LKNEIIGWCIDGNIKINMDSQSTNSLDIKQLFATLISYGFLVKKNKCDGQKSWQKYKSLYESNKTIYHQKTILEIAKLIEYNVDENDKQHDNVTININGKKLSNKIEIEHFFIQLFRISKMNPNGLPLVKLLQIAYNIGQLNAVIELELFDRDIVQFYKSHQCLL